jgi:hypothetical protein
MALGVHAGNPKKLVLRPTLPSCRECGGPLAERQAAQLRGERAVSTMLLVKALGGGWKQTRADGLAAI